MRPPICPYNNIPGSGHAHKTVKEQMECVLEWKKWNDAIRKERRNDLDLQSFSHSNKPGGTAANDRKFT